VIGQLSEDRLDAVRALADDYVFDDDTDPAMAQPGQRVEREVAGHTVLTGTPLGHEDEDPRLEYQLLYHEAAEPLRVCAREALGLELEAADERHPTDAPADLRQWIRDAVNAVVESFRRRAQAAQLDFREVALVPTPASAAAAELELRQRAERRFEVGNLLITIHGRTTEDFAVLLARVERLGREPVSIELLQDGVITVSETLSDELPVLELPLTGARRLVLRILAPRPLDVELPDL
jgi:hypothetical protein